MIDIDISSLLKDIEKKGAEKAKSDRENRQQEIAVVLQTAKNIEKKYYPLMTDLVEIHDSLRVNGFKCDGESGEFGRTNDDYCIKFMYYEGHPTWIELDINHCKFGITNSNPFIVVVYQNGRSKFTDLDFFAHPSVYNDKYKRSFTVTDLLDIIKRPYVSKGKYKLFFKALKQGIKILEQEFESFHDRYIQYAQSLLN